MFSCQPKKENRKIIVAKVTKAAGEENGVHSDAKTRQYMNRKCTVYL